jgi:hypothetical protein
MKSSLNIINAALKPINRQQTLQPNPMTPEELSSIEKRQQKLDEALYKSIESQFKGRRLPNADAENQLKKLRESKRQTSFLLDADLITGAFKRQVERACRRVHTELAKAGRRGIDIEILHHNLAFEYPVLLEAIKKLEKLKRIEWLDNSTVVIVDSVKDSVGKIYDVYVEKILQGKAIVLVNDRLYARLNYYDYEGPRGLLKSGSEFKAVGDLYHENGVLNIRIKQII